MLDTHNAQVAALIADLAAEFIPDDMIERACQDHVRECQFMPRTSQIVARVQSYVQRVERQAAAQTGESFHERMARINNEKLRQDGRLHIMQWIVENASCRLVDPKQLTREQRLA